MDYSLSAALPRIGIGCGCSDERGLSEMRRQHYVSRATPAFNRNLSPGLRDWGSSGFGDLSPLQTGNLALQATSAALSIANQINTMIETWGHNGYNNEATQVVNSAEYQMKQNLAAWNASPKCAADQMQALANFDKLWAGVVQTCTQIAGGPSSDSAAAGTNCIQDRQAGACTWRDSGQCWDWFIAYRDPIANDPDAVQSYDPLTGEILSNTFQNSCAAQPASSSSSTSPTGNGGSTGSTPPVVSPGGGVSSAPGSSATDLWTQISAPQLAGVPVVYLALAGILLLVVME